MENGLRDREREREREIILESETGTKRLFGAGRLLLLIRIVDGILEFLLNEQ